MSEPIPESIPTSADPRSKRPLKKRALSPRSQTALQVEALFKKPDQEIKVPSGSNALTKLNHINAPPEIVANVQGSSAGAGSGEFHVYKASRRREYERLRAMDEEVKSEQDGEKWVREKAEREERDREKTRRNREKRERLKNKKSGKVTTGIPIASGGPATGGGVKARVDNAALSNPIDDNNNQEHESATAEPVGLIIHDDD